MNKQPEVTARTRKKLTDAFFCLLKEKNLSRITVGDISRLAGYNRSTFYEYFTDIPDLLSRVEDQLLENIKTNIRVNAKQSIQVFDLSAFQQIFELLNEPIYLLLGPNGDPTFSHRLRAEIQPLIMLSVGITGGTPHLDYIAAYTYSAIIGLIQYWYENDQILSSQEVCKLLYSLIYHGVIDTLKSEISVKETAPPNP